jgi:hypothetical protein
MNSLTADTTHSPSGHWWRHHLIDQRFGRSSEHSCECQPHNMHLLPSNLEQVDHTRQNCWNPKCRLEHCLQDTASKPGGGIRWAYRHEQNGSFALYRLHFLGRAKARQLRSLRNLQACYRSRNQTQLIKDRVRERSPARYSVLEWYSYQYSRQLLRYVSKVREFLSLK